MSTDTQAAAPAVPPEHLDPGLTVPGWLRRTCERHGDRVALVLGEDEWTFTRLYDETRRMEAALLGLGAGKGTRIAIVMGMRPEWVVTAFAAMSIGAVATPISTFEPAEGRHRLLRHGDAAIVVLQDRMLRHAFLDDLVAAHPGLTGTDPLFDDDLPYLRDVVHLGDDRSEGHVLSWADALDRAPALSPAYLDAVESEIHPTDDAVIIYTSGTSGTPKGVLHHHRSVAIQFDRLPREFSLRPDDVVWGTYPLFWSAGIAWVLGASLAAGAKLILQEYFEPNAALDLIARHKVTFAHATPVQCNELEQAVADHPADLSSLRIVPRDSMLTAVPRPADAPFGGASLGLSETLTLAASTPWDDPIDLRRNTNGRPLPGTLMKIIDPVTGETLPTGEHGEIAIKGTTLMKGYNKMFPETYLDRDGYYRTGDAGSFDEDGYLHWTGRMSQLIRTDAANISPGEVEEALYRISGVKIAAVLGAKDPTYGEIVVACVVPTAGATLTQDDVRAQLKDKLAGYKIPRHVLFLQDDELEMTATGKPVLSRLQEIVADRLGD